MQDFITMDAGASHESWTSMAKKQKVHAQCHLQREKHLLVDETPFLYLARYLLEEFAFVGLSAGHVQTIATMAKQKMESNTQLLTNWHLCEQMANTIAISKGICWFTCQNICNHIQSPKQIVCRYHLKSSTEKRLALISFLIITWHLTS